MSKPSFSGGPTAGGSGTTSSTQGRSRRPDKRQRGNFAVGPVVRIAVDHVLQSFRALPAWGQREAATALTGLYPDLFRGSEPVAQKASGASRPRPAGSVPGNATEKSLSQDVSPLPGVSGKAEKPTPSVRTAVVEKSSTRKERKPKGFQRPEVSDLEFSIRLNNHPETYTREMRAVDESLLSAALAAVSRGESAGQSSEEIRKLISKAKASKSSYERLWPSQRVRRQYAERLACEVTQWVEPVMWSVEDHVLVLTTSRPLSAEMDEGEDKPAKCKLDPTDISFHESSSAPLDISKESIQKFVRRVKGNYAKFDKILWSLNDRVALLWVKESLVSVSWADSADNEVCLPITPAKSPRVKKRKLGTDG